MNLLKNITQNKSNVLLDDVNGKVAQVDPLFKAIGDVGVTVSDVNDSTRNLVLNITNTAQTKVDDIKDKTTGATHIYSIKEVVEAVEDFNLQISLEEAKKKSKKTRPSGYPDGLCL